MPTREYAERIACWCRHCKKSVPKELFLLRIGMCIECRAKFPDEEEAATKMEEAKKLFAQLVEETEHPQTMGVKLESVLDSLVDRFGGVEGFVNSMFAQIQTAMEESPGKSFVLRYFVDIMRLINASNRLQHAQEVTDLTDEQLKNQMKIEALRIVTADSKYGMMLKAMEACGLKVDGVPAITNGMSLVEFTDKVEVSNVPAI